MGAAAPTLPLVPAPARTYIALPASGTAHLARLAADTGHPSSTLWDTDTSERGDSSAGMAADLAALDWAVLEVDALTWEFIEDRDGAEARYEFSVYGVDAVRMEIHAARYKLLANT